MNWANRLTLGRLALTILFVFALSSVWTYGRSIALVLFVLAGISDYFDGEIARRYGTVTKFGKLMDPLVDKVMMAAAFICLVPLGAVPAWVATIVVARDFLITGLRLARVIGGRHPAGGEAGETQDFVANHDGSVLSPAAFRARVTAGRRGRRMVADRMALRGQRFALDYDRPNDLFRTRVSLAPSRADLADGARV